VKTVVLEALALLLVMSVPPAGTAQTAPAGEGVSAEDVVRGVYELVSWEAGETADWDAVRDAFVPEAVVVLRYRELVQFSVDTFLQDFIDFARRSEAGVAGFRETVTSATAWEYGDIAHVVTQYEARILGSDRPPTRGVDSWSLVRRDGRWKVAAVVNELVSPARSLPPGLSR